MRRVLVVGGSGTLGSTVLNSFKRAKWETFSADLGKSIAADHSFILPSAAPGEWKTANLELNEKLKSIGGFSCVLCAAGGWAGGEIGDPAVFDAADSMINVCLRPALATGFIAANHLKPGGLVVLSGADAALDATPGMVAYGMVKSATHHLVKSIAASNAMRNKSTVIGILPSVIDSEQNRANNPNAQTSEWTPPEEISERVVAWAEDSTLVSTGALYAFRTRFGHTTVVDCDDQ